MGWKIPKDIDREVLTLCVAMNQLPGIETLESCCGHKEQPFRIWFQVTDHKTRGLLTLARVTCPRYYSIPFRVTLDHGDINQILYLLEGPVGAYFEAEQLAGAILSHIENKIDGYNILLDR